VESPIYAQELEHCADREDRHVPHAERRNRESYYVFHQGALQVRVFDRQTIGW
jgi:hypothetical protein